MFSKPAVLLMPLAWIVCAYWSCLSLRRRVVAATVSLVSVSESWYCATRSLKSSFCRVSLAS